MSSTPKRVGGARLGRIKDPLNRPRIRRTIAFDEDLYEALELLAKEANISVQWLVQVLLRRATGVAKRIDRVLDRQLEIGRTKELKRRAYGPQDPEADVEEVEALESEVIPQADEPESERVEPEREEREEPLTVMSVADLEERLDRPRW